MNHDKEIKASEEVSEVDPWVAAFAALEQKDDTGADVPSADNVESGEAGDDSAGSSVPADTNANINSELDEGDDSGFNPVDGEASFDNGDGEAENSWTPEELEQATASIKEDIQNQAINEVAEAFKAKGIRTTQDGQLGARLDDPDIYKKDEDGVMRFYNPETGKPFTGDNPRAQAKQWVEDYNQELKEAFNRVAQQRIDQLEAEAKPQLELLAFVPTYEKLDPIRRDLFDAIIEDCEVKDKKGNVVGYSCDLNKALNQVERQITRIKAQQSIPEVDKTPTGPAVDMKASASDTSDNNRTPKDLAEALSMVQERELAKLNKKGK